MDLTLTLAAATSPITAEVRRQFESEYQDRHGRSRGPGLYSEADWRRLDYMLSILPTSGSILDVGVGPGAFVQMLVLSGRYERVCGIDIRKQSKFVTICDFERHDMYVQNMSFEDASFDTVVCMEVLEHVEFPDFVKGLGELRRVARGELYMTVPFEEPEPLPNYHKQRFEVADLDRHFPSARRSLMNKPNNRGVPWVLLKENPVLGRQESV